MAVGGESAWRVAVGLAIGLLFAFLVPCRRTSHAIHEDIS